MGSLSGSHVRVKFGDEYSVDDFMTTSTVQCTDSAPFHTSLGGTSVNDPFLTPIYWDNGSSPTSLPSF